MTRVRIDDVLRPHQRVRLDEAQAHHLRVVLRAKISQSVVVVAQGGASWNAQITTLSPLELEILGPHLVPSADPAHRLELWVPLLKGGKSDDLVRQLTEIGASELVCYVSTRSVARLDARKVAKRIARWRVIAAEATRQCGRHTLPHVRYSEGLPDIGPGVYLWEEGGASATACLRSSVEQGTLRVLVGPEGGLEVDEAAALNALGWSAASLGPRILRAETAVLVAATLALVALEEPHYAARL